MAVPSSGTIYLSKILREIQYCDFVGSNQVGGYLSNGTFTATNVSLAGLDTNSSVRTADTNRGDGSAPYAMSEWYSYSDLEPDKINIYFYLTEGVSGSPVYTIRIFNGTRTRTFFIGGAYGNTVTGQTDRDGGTSINIRFDKTSPSSTAQDDGSIDWWSVTSQCASVWTLDQTSLFSLGDSITNFNYDYTNVQDGYSFKGTIIEG